MPQIRCSRICRLRISCWHISSCALISSWETTPFFSFLSAFHSSCTEITASSHSLPIPFKAGDSIFFLYWPILPTLPHLPTSLWFPVGTTTKGQSEEVLTDFNKQTESRYQGSPSLIYQSRENIQLGKGSVRPLDERQNSSCQSKAKDQALDQLNETLSRSSNQIFFSQKTWPPLWNRYTSHYLRYHLS